MYEREWLNCERVNTPAGEGGKNWLGEGGREGTRGRARFCARPNFATEFRRRSRLRTQSRAIRVSINKINDAINRTRLSVDLSLSFSYSPSLPLFPLSLLLTHSMSSCRYPRVDGNKKKKITDRFYIKNGTKGSRALARGSSMKNCRCVHSLPPGYRYAIHVGKYRGHECPSGLIGFSKLYLLFSGPFRAGKRYPGAKLTR